MERFLHKINIFCKNWINYASRKIIQCGLHAVPRTSHLCSKKFATCKRIPCTPHGHAYDYYRLHDDFYRYVTLLPGRQLYAHTYKLIKYFVLKVAHYNKLKWNLEYKRITLYWKLVINLKNILCLYILSFNSSWFVYIRAYFHPPRRHFLLLIKHYVIQFCNTQSTKFSPHKVVNTPLISIEALQFPKLVSHTIH